jgi:hypothetical protein
MEGSVVFGVVGGTPEEPRVGYLEGTLPVTPDVLALVGEVDPMEVFRMAAPCAGGACQHFDGARCRLVARIVDGVPPVVDQLAPCAIRSWCRWWREAGPEACRRCPAVVTSHVQPSDSLRRAADPAAPAPIASSRPAS